MSVFKTLEPGWVWHNGIALPEVVFNEHQEAIYQETLKHIEASTNAPDERNPEDKSEHKNAVERKLKKSRIAGPKWEDPYKDYTGPKHKLFDHMAVEVFQQKLGSRYTDSDDRNRAKALVEDLRNRGEYRKLGRLPTEWRGMLDQMTVMFPHFEEVIRYLRAMFVLSSYGDCVPSIDPILLNGPPGVGKTFFAEYFAKQLGVGFVCLRMENAQSNSALSGSSEFWSNTKPSELFKSLIEKEYANPVFFLDELDKAAGDPQYSPLSSIYSLFEPDTARTFCDLSFPWLSLDASRVIWIATSNNAELLPAPILSRLKRFDIPLPSRKAARRLVLQIFFRLRTELPSAVLPIKLTSTAVDILSARTPRSIRQLLREAISRTLLRGGRRVEMQDISICLDRSETSKIGFM